METTATLFLSIFRHASFDKDPEETYCFLPNIILQKYHNN
jgi:hypothetical protein